MARWEPDSRGRLEQAALALFDEHGFERTTVAEIAARAGVTERTFFRHFADKREVLFGGADGGTLNEPMTRAVAAAPASAGPLDAVAAGLDAAAALLQERRPFALRRQRLIAATPELQERELIKLSALAGALAAVLRERGVEEPEASLAAEAGIAAFRVAFERWIAAPGEPSLADEIAAALARLRVVAGPPAGS